MERLAGGLSPGLRRFQGGFLASRVGDWIYLVALNWAVLTMTESALMLGVINACRLVPALLMSLPSGVMADRYECRRLLGMLYGTVALFTALNGLLILAGAPLWVVALAVILRELANTCEPPIRNTLLGDLEPENLPRALALNASVMNLGRVIGPAVAGGLLAAFGLAPAFTAAALGLGLCGWLTWRLETPGQPGLPRVKSGGGIGEAVAYLRGDRRLKLLIAMMVAPMLLAFPYVSMLPLFTKELLGLGPEGFGLLLSLSAVGSLVASTTIVGTSDRVLNGRFQVITLAVFSLSLVALVLAPHVAVAAVALFVAGAASQAYRTVSRILVQTGVPRELQGRIISIVLMDRGLMPLGALLIGWVATAFGTLAGGLLMGLGSGLATALLVLVCPDIMSLRSLRRGSDGFHLKPLTQAPTVRRAARTAVTVVMLFALPWLTGCSRSEASPDPAITVRHAWGETGLARTPARVVVLDLSFLDMMAVLDVAPVGFAGTSDGQVPDYLQERLGEVVFVGERKQPNLEVILSLEPDLIVANPDRHRTLKDELNWIAPTIALDDRSYQEVLGNLDLLGGVLGRQEQARVFKGRFEASLAELKARSSRPPTVLVVGAFEDEFTVWTGESFVASLLRGLGARYAFTGPSMSSESQTEVAKLSVERLRGVDPDCLFVYGDLDRWADDPLFSQLRAVRAGRVLEVSRDLWSRSRGPLAATMMMEQSLPVLHEE